jgi:hypothetical protein
VPESTDVVCEIKAKMALPVKKYKIRFPISRATRKECAVGVVDKDKPSDPVPAERKKRRFLSPEKKYQLFLEAQRRDASIGELLRREGLYSIDLARIQRKAKEGALERLAQRPGRSKKTVSEEEYAALKQELEEKEQVMAEMAEMAVELAILRKKTNGGSWER